jgi:hypothetical protein
MHGKMRNAFSTLVGQPERKRTLGRPRPRWKDNIKMDLWETGLEGVDWICLVQDKDWWQDLVNMVKNLWVCKRQGMWTG